MREFLYIGQVVDTKEWVEGYLTACNDASGRSYFIVCPGETERDDVGYQVDPASIRACTGKRDRKGRRIYEGSVCRFYDDEGGTSDYCIEWSGNCAGYICAAEYYDDADVLDDFFCENCEVVDTVILTEKVPQTNYERICRKSIEEMAEMIYNMEDELGVKGCSAEHCPAYDADGFCEQVNTDVCKQAILNWLKSEVW